MAETGEISAWIAFFVGLYALAAAAGEFRAPDTWLAMLDEFERNPALRLLTGVVVLTIGAAIYLVNPWVRGDWLSIAVSVIGGLAVAEGLLILAAGDRYLRFARKLVGGYGRAWAAVAALFGIALVLVALSRMQAF